jgi:RNA polymerase sigma factor (sigma-70 family)
MAARPRHRSAGERDRRLSVAEAQFYARVYSSARKGSLVELRRRGCTEQEAEEVFADAYAKTMESVDPIARQFTAPQMVNFVKRTCWRCLIDERRRSAVRGELEASGLGSRPSVAEPPEELAAEREAVAIGREALAMLPERERRIFRQRHLLGMTPQEIAAQTPGLSVRSYRRTIRRANTLVLEAFARIEIGERCTEMEGALLRRYLAGESPPGERHAVEAHLAHCRACQQAGARMRGYLIDVASGALLASSLAGAGSPALAGSVPARLLELASQGTRLLGGASRAARERLREGFAKTLGALPGSGTDAGAAQALGATSVRIASVCTAGIAAGACVAAGVVPGIGAIGSSGHRHARPSPPARRARAVSAPVAAGVGESAPSAISEGGSGPAGASASARGGAAKTEAGAPSVSRAKPSGLREGSPASARASGRQTGTEFGVESTQASTPNAPPPSSSPSQGASGGSLASGASAGGGGTSAAGGSGSKSAGGSGSEFGM